MHILLTADTVGGVWTYTQELVRGLIRRGNRVTLISFGGLPRAEQTAWMDDLPDLDYRPTRYRLEWMQESENDVEESKSYVESLIRQVRPDVLHFNQYCYGNIQADVPRIVVAHSDVVSWWAEVHQREPDDNRWSRWYRDTVTRGLGSADVVVAPSQWMLDAVRKYYTRPSYGIVVYNGRELAQFDADGPKDNLVLSVGRLWDKAKQVSLLCEIHQLARVCIVGSTEEPGRQRKNRNYQPVPATVELRGSQSQEQLQSLYSRAAMYAATSCYEPFGLAPLEAALSRCALVANDIPVFHELWGDSAIYFRRNDAADLAFIIGILSSSNKKLLRRCGDLAYEHARKKFPAARMVEQYESLYQSMTSVQKVA